jgi:hypothetical protein
MAYPPQSPTPPRPKSRVGIYAAIVVVVVVIVAVVLYVGLSGLSTSSSNNDNNGNNGGGGTTPTYVDITGINLNPTAEASTCWTSSSGTGGEVVAGQSYDTSWTFSYTKSLFGPDSCTIQSVSMQTNGFTIVSANTPLVVDSGGSQVLTIVIGTPSSAYTGAVTIDMTVTAS